MTLSEKHKIIMKRVINSHYQEDEFELFKAEYGWEDWMNDYTEAEEDEPITEQEQEEIEEILKEGFEMAFDKQWKKIYEFENK